MMTIKNRAATVLIGALACGFAASAATAMPAEIGRGRTKVAEAAQAQPATVAEDDDTANCSKSRKRLWVEGEGWIVRRITICR